MKGSFIFSLVCIRAHSDNRLSGVYQMSASMYYLRSQRYYKDYVIAIVEIFGSDWVSWGHWLARMCVMYVSVNLQKIPFSKYFVCASWEQNVMRMGLLYGSGWMIAELELHFVNVWKVVRSLIRSVQTFYPVGMWDVNVEADVWRETFTTVWLTSLSEKGVVAIENIVEAWITK
jgi:hypothetical protein